MFLLEYIEPQQKKYSEVMKVDKVYIKFLLLKNLALGKDIDYPSFLLDIH